MINKAFYFPSQGRDSRGRFFQGWQNITTCCVQKFFYYLNRSFDSGNLLDFKIILQSGNFSSFLNRIFDSTKIIDQTNFLSISAYPNSSRGNFFDFVFWYVSTYGILLD